ncbi:MULTISPECIES: acyl-CoA thioesterase [Sphingobacterium]|uniref:4-hydroxybenzoyl-CoA thioesterase n=1 Tax=Sphingobacterium cellulitidis TaxID=1768011 RepID=A0A8H9KSD0_9SPHI|nr:MULTISPECIES: thioesterase family protein [Sphingobacterium]MBA8985437.1 4-hydroxybenzoyl-CoA thioesterase [Sphingobacterium soli]WFB63859.1 thioesterase family protein [Sphingobacterium sp. WM]GGE09664.1 4-hydroxybenzoyl-CoA thioesterase [Sphingobacterium soli]
MGQVFTKKQKVKFQHCDAAGIVFYPRFMEMLNELVEDWFEEELGFPFKELHHGEGIPTADLKVAFVSPARLGDVFVKSLTVSKLGNSSLTYNFKFAFEDRIVLQGECTLVHVGLSQDQLKSQPWSNSVRENIQRFIQE